MKYARAASIFALLAAQPAVAGNVGFMHRMVPDGTNPPLDVGIWYPTAAAPHPTRVALFTQTLAADAPLAGSALPLVVMSHGHGGEFAGHSDTAWALASAGFVVAAPTHTGDNYRDQSRATDIGGRVRQFSAVLSYMETAWKPGAVDPARAGAFGFSAGGMTVLIAAGGALDLSLIGPHCAAHPGFFDCHLLRDHKVAPPAAPTLVTAPSAAKLRAIVVAAPALGYSFTREGLRAVTAKVQLWRADNDHILPAPFYADTVRANLPLAPDFQDVPNAGHFDFLAPCPPALVAIAPDICTSAPGFSRAAFHARFNQDIVAFFAAHLAP